MKLHNDTDTRIKVDEYADGRVVYTPQFHSDGFFFSRWFCFYENNKMCEGDHVVTFASQEQAQKYLNKRTLVKTEYLVAKQ